MFLGKMFFVLFILGLFACGADTVKITENDHTIFFLEKKDNKNKVIYAVNTNGKCAITGIFPYWKMDEEDGHTEELLSIEEGVYGVKDVKEIKEALWMFDIAKMPERKIKALAIATTSTDKLSMVCSFKGDTLVNGEESHLDRIFVNNDGTTVHTIEFYGTRVTDGTPVHETYHP